MERFNGVPFAIVPPDLQALHVVDVEKQRHGGASVRVRRQADHLVDQRNIVGSAGDLNDGGWTGQNLMSRDSTGRSMRYIMSDQSSF